MATLGDLIRSLYQQPQQGAQNDPGFNAAQPWNSAALQAPPVQPTASQTPSSNTPIPYAQVDPWAEAQHQAQRHAAAASLGGGTTPVLELPSDLLDIISKWFKDKQKESK